MNKAISADSRSRTWLSARTSSALIPPSFTLTTILRVHVVKEFQAVNAAVRALLLALEGLGFHERHGPPLELVFVPRGEVARGVEVFGRAVDFVFQFGGRARHSVRAVFGLATFGGQRTARPTCAEGVFEPFLDERNGEVRDVYADPLAVELLRGVNGCAATAERVEHHVAFVAAGGNDAFQQGQRLLCWITKAFRTAAANRRQIGPNILKLYPL